MTTEILDATIEQTETSVVPEVVDAEIAVEEDAPSSAVGGDEVPPHIRELSDEVKRASAVVASRKDELKEAKDALDAAIARLVAATGGDNTSAILTHSDACEPPAPPDDWRTVRLDDKRFFPSLRRGTVRILAEAGYETLGVLADFTASGKLLTDLPRIGESKATEIEEATWSYWQRFPEAPADEPASGGELAAESSPV